MSHELPGTKRLALSVVLRAIHDMKNKGAINTTAPTRQERNDAIVWLCSRKAAAWFDGAGINQWNVLLANDWGSHARDVLDGGLLSEEQQDVVLQSLKAFAVVKDKIDRGF